MKFLEIRNALKRVKEDDGAAGDVNTQANIDAVARARVPRPSVSDTHIHVHGEDRCVQRMRGAEVCVVMC